MTETVRDRIWDGLAGTPGVEQMKTIGADALDLWFANGQRFHITVQELVMPPTIAKGEGSPQDEDASLDVYVPLGAGP